MAELRERRGAPTMSCSLNTVQYCQDAHAPYNRTIVQCVELLGLPGTGYIVPALAPPTVCSARAWIMDSHASAVECSPGQPQASKRSGSCGGRAEGVVCGGRAEAVQAVAQSGCR